MLSGREMRAPGGTMASERERRPNIRDVAARAGVSYQTVSRALNRHPNVKAATLAKVEAAIVELGYRPNAAARALVRQRSQTIGLLTLPTTDYGPQTQQIAIETAARDAGYRIALTNAASGSVEDLAAGLTFLRETNVDALVVSVAETAVLEALGQLRVEVPYVTLEPTGLAFGHSVAIDQRLGARMAVDHLAALGHRRIAQLRGPRGSIDASARARGVEERAAELGLELVGTVEGDWTPRSGYERGPDVLALDATGIAVGNDQMALGLLHACRDAGLRVPEDRSVVGFDDVPEAPHYPTALTTIRQEFEEVGAAAMRVLLDDLAGRAGLVHLRIPPTLVERGSTARVR
ncbi:LacI family transcriptional regulator [Agrococcus terreus]|uniref:LacI family transcriptional regulator n=2 Tax=Agrococcus terreus TaxID=574649 RepID=A0ABQ2KQ02_9MICO|nr:LacI family transcriptional regulator [Agrococcus terreus]